MVYIFSLATGLLSGFVMPASNSVTPLILPENDLQAGNSLSMGTMQLMGFIGPALAGVIIGSYAGSIQGVAIAFAVDSLTFAFCAITLSLMHGVDRENTPRSEKQSEESIWDSIKVAGRYIVGHDSLRLIFVIMTLVNFLFTGPLLVGIPVLADQRLAEGAAAFGLLMSGYAGGNVLGYVLAGALPKPSGRVLSLVIVGLISSFGIVLCALGWIASTWLDFIIMLGIGIGNGYIGLVLFTWIQQTTPKDKLGRIMSMTMLASMGLVPLSQAIAGAISKWNLTGLFVLAGGLMLVVSAWLALNPRLQLLSDQMLDAVAVDHP
jgi:MFS family permease